MLVSALVTGLERPTEGAVTHCMAEQKEPRLTSSVIIYWKKGMLRLRLPTASTESHERRCVKIASVL